MTLSEAKAKAREDAELIRKAASKYPDGMRCNESAFHGGSAYGQLKKRRRRTKLGTYTLFAGICLGLTLCLIVLATTIYRDHPWFDGVWRMTR